MKFDSFPVSISSRPFSSRRDPTAFNIYPFFLTRTTLTHLNIYRIIFDFYLNFKFLSLLRFHNFDCYFVFALFEDVSYEYICRYICKR